MPANAGSVNFNTAFLTHEGSDLQVGFNDGRPGSDGKKLKRALVHVGYPASKDQLVVNFYDTAAKSVDYKDGVVLGGPVNIITGGPTATIAVIDAEGKTQKLILTGPVTVTGDLVVEGSLAVTGALTVGSLVVTGATTLNGQVTLGNLPAEDPNKLNKGVLIEPTTNRLVKDV